MATVNEWLKLALPELKGGVAGSGRKRDRACARSSRMRKSWFRLGVALPGAGAPPPPNGASGGGGMGPVDVRSAKEQLTGCVAED